MKTYKEYLAEAAAKPYVRLFKGTNDHVYNFLKPWYKDATKAEIDEYWDYQVEEHDPVVQIECGKNLTYDFRRLKSGHVIVVDMVAGNERMSPNVTTIQAVADEIKRDGFKERKVR